MNKTNEKKETAAPEEKPMLKKLNDYKIMSFPISRPGEDFWLVFNWEKLMNPDNTIAIIEAIDRGINEDSKIPKNMQNAFIPAVYAAKSLVSGIDLQSKDLYKNAVEIMNYLSISELADIGEGLIRHKFVGFTLGHQG
jgi:hypothetical protein